MEKLKSSNYSISAEQLGYGKARALFVLHNLTDDEKLLRVQHCEHIVRE